MVRQTRLVTAAGLVAAGLCMQGCVFWEIRDDLRTTNTKLVQVQSDLDRANSGLDSANSSLAVANANLDKVETGLKRLDRTNTLIDDVGQGLGRIDRTNDSLTDLEKQLALLASIEKSLGRLDQHLAAVRQTISSLDKMVPFLDLGGGYEEPTAETPVPTTAAEPAPSDGTPAATVSAVVPVQDSVRASTDPSTTSAPTAGATPRREALVGIWVRKYPDSNVAIVVLNDGRYIRSDLSGASTASVQAGRWKRTGAVTMFTPIAQPTPAQAEQVAMGENVRTPTAPIPAVNPTPPAWEATLVSSGNKSFAIQVAGELWVFERP